MPKKDTKLETASYKGVRDFYPEDLFIQRWIFARMRNVVERYGYVEYDTSVLEPSELYRAKSGEEIVNEQTYSFTDRGNREVTLRPEMTPSVARLVAARQRDLVFPLRWYSIPNLFRYERPQRGRLREHWQLNVDIFGVVGIDAEIEIISIARDIMHAFGATDSDFIIRINHRALLNALFHDYLGVTDEQGYTLAKLIDRREKMEKGTFQTELETILGEKADMVHNCCNATTLDDLLSHLPDQFRDMECVGQLEKLFGALGEIGITNTVFDPSLVRGFDYYTGVVFEVFDTNPKNNRALFGGGRYDGLTEIFGTEPVPAIGFGMGDVTIRDFVEERGLLPTYHSTATLYLCVTDASYMHSARAIAETLRSAGVSVAVDLSSKRVGDQIRIADKQHIPYIICIGEEEQDKGVYKVKNLATSEETELRVEEIPTFLTQHATARA